MALSKLQIIPEKKGAYLEFDKGAAIEALFNPHQLALNRTVSWQKANAKERDVPELQFTNAEPRTLTLDLIFDTYDTPEAQKRDVRKRCTDEILHLTTVERHPDMHRPPVCRLRWGKPGYFFQGVLERLDHKFTMFMDDGTPVRATLTCTFKEWRTNYDDLNQQRTQSADVAKVWVIKRGDTLSSIAAEEYLNPALWRHIATRNHLADPLDLQPGQMLILPKLTLGDLDKERASRL
jgi:hypothetical protein